MVREKNDKKTNDLQTRHFVPEIWQDMSDGSKRKEKQKWSVEKPKLDNARRLRGIHFIDPDDGEFKDIMKNARRKVEVPMPAAMPCKIQREKYRETCRVEKNCKTKYACIVEADESTRKRTEGSLHKNHEDHIAGKGMNSLSRYNLVHKFVPMPQALRIPDTKAAAGEGMGKTPENTACKSSWSHIGNLKSCTLTIPWNLAKLVKIFLESLHVYTTPIRNKWDC